MRRLLFLMLALGTAAGLFMLATAVQDPVIIRYRVPITGLAQPLRIVHLSDIHFSWIDMPSVRLRRIIARANAERPDLVVLTGDYAGAKIVDWPDIRLEDALYPLAGLKAPLGVFAVPGNHDEPYWLRRVMARTPVRLLAGASVDLGPLVLAGADDLLIGVDPIDGLNNAIAAVPPGKPVIAASHEPDFFARLPQHAQLLLSGHSHGGQISLFGLAWLPTEYIARHRRGLFREGRQTLIVNSGLGTTLVPLRLGVPPEIVVVDLVPAQAGRKSGTER